MWFFSLPKRVRILELKVSNIMDELTDIKSALDQVQQAATAAAEEISKLASEIANLQGVDPVARAAIVDEATTIAKSLNDAAAAGG
jgi:hypothetical protein